MCLFVLVLGLLGPRIALACTWIFTERVQVAFSGGAVLPALGLIFLPWTALVYVFSYAPGTGVSTLGWFLVAAAFILDMLTYSNRAIAKKYSTA